ncbi:hypothetical protein EDB87DRAFT_1693873 [Lactarius vividus]|nr:hypothetical protein EDB87DRAFT_1693873 [Lactarius vividus]
MVQKDLDDEIIREINEAALGYGQYYLKEPKLTLRPQHDFVLKQNQLQTAVLVTIQALDAGTAMHPGDTSTTFLTPQSWFRLTAAVLGAIIRGNLHSPNNVINRIKPVNTNDKYEIHKDLVHPLTEGATIRHMALQIAEAYDKTHTNPLKLNPTEFYEKLLATKLDTLTKAAEIEAKAHLNISDIQSNVHQNILNNSTEMDNIQHAVKEAIFNELNKEALEDLNTWREIYREEFKEVMHQYIGVNKFGIDPVFLKPNTKGKRRAKSATPELQSANEDIERIMRADCQAQIDNMRNITLTEMTAELNREIAAYKTAEFTRLQVEALLHLETEIEALKVQFREEHEAQVYRHRDDIRDQIKAWKVNHANARKFEFIRKEAKNLGYTLVANSTDAYKPISDPQEAELAWLPSSRPASRTTTHNNTPSQSWETSRTRATTPPRLVINPYIPDPNVTPTPVRVKCIRTDDTDQMEGEPQSNITYRLPTPTPPTLLPKDISLPPSSIPSPMEEDEPLDSLHQWLSANNGGTATSMHAPHRDTVVPPLPTPSLPVAVPEQPLVMPSAEPAPLPAPLPYLPSRLVAPAPPAPNLAAQDGELVAMLRLIQGTISRLEEKIAAQDARLDNLVAGTEVPKAKGKRVRVAAPTSTPEATKPQVIYPTTWATVTGKGAKQQHTNSTLANQAAKASNRHPSGTPKDTSKTSNDITEVTVLRGKGVEDPEVKKTISNILPSVIVNTARSESRNPPPTPSSYSLADGQTTPTTTISCTNLLAKSRLRTSTRTGRSSSAPYTPENSSLTLVGTSHKYARSPPATQMAPSMTETPSSKRSGETTSSITPSSQSPLFGTDYSVTSSRKK